MAKFTPGHQISKGKGRPMGSKNKRTDLFAIIEEVGLDPFKEMVTLAKLSTDPSEKYFRCQGLAPYLYPKLKNLEITLADLPDEEILAEAEKRLTKKNE